MKETFIVPLLHPYTTSPIALPVLEYDNLSQPETAVGSPEYLPIASRLFSSPAVGSDDSEDDNGGAGTTSHVSLLGGQSNLDFVPEHDSREPLASGRQRDSFVLSWSHRSSGLPPRRKYDALPTVSFGHISFMEPSFAEEDRDRGCKYSADPSAQGMQHKSKGNITKADLMPYGGVGIAPYHLPDDLRRCLELIENNIIAGHVQLSEGLRKRYDEQYPLVRSLVDLFVVNVRLIILISYRPDL